MNFFHTKISYDQSFDYNSIGEQLYDGRFLIMIEQLGTNPHVHFQGETKSSFVSYRNKFALLTAEHYARKQDPNCRPVKHSNKEITDKGFQYMCKEKNYAQHVLARRGFTDEDLDKLHEASEEHVDELKNGLKRKWDQVSSNDVSYSDMPRRLFFVAFDYYIEVDKVPPPNLKRRCFYETYKKYRGKPEEKAVEDFVFRNF